MVESKFHDDWNACDCYALIANNFVARNFHALHKINTPINFQFIFLDAFMLITYCVVDYIENFCMTLFPPKQSDNPLVDSKLTPIACAWLCDPNSLTRRLREYTNHQIQFNVISSGEWKLTADQKKIWMRHIQWCLNNVLWVDAEVMIPENSMQPELMKVGKTPVGELLFPKNILVKRDFIFTKNNDDSWTRESRVVYKEKPIYICEKFLPEFFLYVGLYAKVRCKL